MQRCTACGGVHISTFTVKGYEYACCACGTAWLAAPDTRPANLYDRAYFEDGAFTGYAGYDRDEALHRANAQRRLRFLPREAVQARLIDVGCATGYFLDVARGAGWSVAGVDLSAWAREQAQRRFDLDVHESLQSVGIQQADAVTFFQSLEHLPQPLVALQQAAAALKPDGRLVVETWDRASLVARLFGRNWQQVSPPSVLHLFSRRGLRTLLARAGFAEVRFHRTRKQVSLGHVSRLLAGKSMLFKPAANVVDLMGLARWSMGYGFGDLVTLTARKADGPLRCSDR